MKKIIILGSTGSIGTQAVEVALKHPDKYKVVAISTNTRVPLALEQAKKLNCKSILITDESASKTEITNDLKVFKGHDQIIDFLHVEADLVLNAIVGSSGLEATLTILEKGIPLALANKESLVVGGDIINKRLREAKKNIIPVDSEHSAIYQLLLGENKKEINKIIITASGGPFREASNEEIKEATPEQALAHPRWNMGPKITIDSATLVNKGLEVMEAHYLFDMSYEKVEAIIHPQSIIHSMVEFADGSVKAHLGPTDMRIPIQYAMSYPERETAPAGFSDFLQIGKLTFEPVDFDRFRALKLAYEAGKKGNGYPVAYNSANEEAVAAFLDNRIGFDKITEVLEEVMNSHEAQPADELGIVKEMDIKTREKAAKAIKEHE
ncbi:hypothetical protein LCGC14_0649030 [marine sediment metagenome]|uniref:1-deoxy-D-xylulose-5-phosphate reductoisomerase n=1 Tax=marine sediment metagenome TaxID=412755 RepID=A0A0F9TIN9_9ZZZZ